MPFLLLAWIAILDVEVRGNRLVSEEAVRHHLGELDESSLPEAFRRLWETGLFEDLRFETVPIEGGLRLVVVVEEKRLLREVRISSERIEEAELRERLPPLPPRKPFGEADAFDLERIAEVIVGERFDVEAELVAVSDTLVDVELRIIREELPRIANIAFVGNERLDGEELEGAMRLEESSWLSWLTRRDRLDPDVLEEDLERIRSLYRGLGYALVAVGPARVDPHARGVAVRIPVDEGERYRFGPFSIAPGPLLTEDEIRGWLPRPGTLFDGQALAEVVGRIERHYRDRGYASARVDVEETPVLREGAIATSLTVEEGPFVRIGRISFDGNRRHRDGDLRALLELAEGQPFDQGELMKDTAALMSLGHFRAVIPDVDVDAALGRANVTFQLDEIDPFEYLLGGGFNPTQGGSGSGQLVARSLLQRSETIRLDLDLGNRFQSFAASYRDPSLLNAVAPRLTFALDFRRADLTFPDDTSEDSFDLAVGVGGPTRSNVQLAGIQRLARFTLETTLDADVPFLTPFLGRTFLTSRTSLALSYETAGDSVFPLRGRSVELGYELVTVDVEAHRLRARLVERVALDASARHGLAVTGRTDAVWSFGETRTVGLPRFERLFLGGENDLRGFDVRSVGPRSDDVVVGGDRLVYGSVEYVFSAADRLRLVAFFDAGSVWATDFEGEELPSLRYDAGGELRVLVPLANVPVRTGYGLDLDPLPGEPRGRFFFTLAVRF